MRFALVLNAATACLALASLQVSDSPANSTRHLSRRYDSSEPASDEEWTDSKCRGERLVELMLASDEKAGEMLKSESIPPSAKSEWQGNLRQELKTWAWTDRVYDKIARLDDQSVSQVLKDLGINGKPESQGGNNVGYAVEHQDNNAKDTSGKPVRAQDQRYKVGNKNYRVTGAVHHFVVNRKDGVIIGSSLMSPNSAALNLWQREAYTDELPALRRLSDIFWGYWFRDNTNVKNIRYFWMQEVINPSTVRIIARAIGAYQALPDWPGTTFDMDSDAGKALLGSPNGAVFAWFLIQHKEQLGNKKIVSATIFIDDMGEFSYGDPHVIFEVKDVESKANGMLVADTAP